MKKGGIFTAISLMLAGAVCACSMSACKKDEAARFSESEYVVRNGDTVNVESGKATYKLLGSVPDGVTVSVSGTFSVGANVPDGTQVVLGALSDGVVVSTAVCTVSVNVGAPSITFDNLSSYIVDGERVQATSDPVFAVTYGLKNKVDGIEIDSVTGKVSYSGSVADGTQFTVTATARGAVEEKTFLAATQGLVTAVNSTAISEYSKGDDVSFTLDFGGNAQLKNGGVIGVSCGSRRASSEDWTYDAAASTVTIKKSFTSKLNLGENTVKLNTDKNTVFVTVKSAEYITTAEEFAAIRSSREALSGYYIMLKDIDLTDYLSDKPEGWTPIGEYRDVLDGTATDFAFAGTFDGNGHTLSGFYIDRNDEFAYNSGVFGYVSNNGTIKNLNVVQHDSKQHNARSYSGAIAGVNCGIIENCSANVSFEIDEAFKTVGGFVGRNEGTISHSYNIGGAKAGSEFGSFCGLNSGNIVNCYSVTEMSGIKFCGSGSAEGCEQFSEVNQLISADFSDWDGWIKLEGKLPVQPVTEVDYALRGITITNTAKTVIRGETFRINVVANPADKIDLNAVEYSVEEGEGVFVNSSGMVNTRNAQGHDCTVKAVYCGFTAYYSFKVYEKTQSVQFAQTLAEVRAGENLTLNATVLPSGANQQVEYSLAENYQGASIKGNVLSVDYRASEGNIKVRAVSSDGLCFDELNVSVKANECVKSCNLILYRDETSAANFVLPAGAAEDVKRVTCADKEVKFTVNGGAVSIERSAFEGLGIEEAILQFFTDSKVYVGSVSVYNRADVVEIGTVEQFMAFKNDETQYGKIIVLTAELDFEGAEITSVGNSKTEKYFKGVFNGNGHKISNLKITRNDFDGEESNGDHTTYKYHSSYYNVGLFSLVEGTVCNVVFENVTVKPLFEGEPVGNFVGIVCGTLNGKVSGCDFINCTYGCAGEFKGLVTGKNEGTVSSCYEI